MKTVPLGELITPAAVRRAGDGDYPILSMTMRQGLVDQASKFKKRVASDDLSAYRVVERGQLVVGFPIDEGVLDVQNLYEAAIVSPAYNIWNVIDTSGVSREYLKRFLRSPQALSYYKAKLRGSTARRRSLPKDVFLNLQIPLPSRDEQRRAIEAIAKSELLCRSAEDALDLFDALSESIFIESFSRSPLKKLGDSLEFLTSGGRGWAKYYADEGEPFIRSLDVRTNQVSTDDLAFVVAPDNAEARRTRTQGGDVLLTITGSRIGRAAPLPKELAGAYVSQHVAILRPRSEVLMPEFLSAFLCCESMGQKQIRGSQYGQTKPGLNFRQIEGFLVPDADLDQQREFCLRMGFVQKMLAKSQCVGVHLREVHKSLQYRAFSGQL